MNSGNVWSSTADWIPSISIARAARAARATREQMSEAKLPLPYRDSCAHLLIPLNRCRFEEFYLPWKCVVRSSRSAGGSPDLADWECDRMRDIRTRNASIWSLRRG